MQITEANTNKNVRRAGNIDISNEVRYTRQRGSFIMVKAKVQSKVDIYLPGTQHQKYIKSFTKII